MNALTRFDTSALNRALVGFDRIFNDFDRYSNQINNNYPPYNIVKHDENLYEIQIAVSGFDKEEITVEVDQDQLIVKGSHTENSEDGKVFLHRGLAARDFTRTFTLHDHMEVGEGRIKNGVLSVEIRRVIPESLKPRLIKVTAE